MKIKTTLVALIIFFLPSFLVAGILRLLGHKVGKNLHVGFSIIFANHIEFGNNVRIGHFNLFKIKRVNLSNFCSVGYMNISKGPFDLILKEKASFGNKNYFTRGPKGISYGISELRIGYNSRITVGHHLDLTQSISFGENSILAGIRSQMWTHGYYHADRGPERIRIDGETHIGDNVYIGSGCIFNPGVKVSNSIHIGGGSVIAKDLKIPGMYVGQSIRFIDNNIDKIKNKLTNVEERDLLDNVYTKKN